MGKVIDFKKAATRKQQSTTVDAEDAKMKNIEDNVGTLVRTVLENKQLIVVPCINTKTHEKILALCTAVEVSKGQFMILPLVQIFEGNPLDYLKPSDVLLTGA